MPNQFNLNIAQMQIDGQPVVIGEGVGQGGSLFTIGYVIKDKAEIVNVTQGNRVIDTVLPSERVTKFGSPDNAQYQIVHKPAVAHDDKLELVVDGVKKMSFKCVKVRPFQGFPISIWTLIDAKVL